MNPPRLCNHVAKPHGVSGLVLLSPSPAHIHVHVHSLCENTVTDFSQLLLAAAKLYFCWIVVFPTRKHSPGGQLYVLPRSQRRDALAAVFRFGGGSGTTFGPGNASVRKAASYWRPVAPKCSTMRSETAQGAQRDSKSSLLDLPGRPFWSKLASVSSLRKTSYLPCFHHIEPPRDCPLSHC